MMACECAFVEEEEEEQFFDARDDLSCRSDSCPGPPESRRGRSSSDGGNWGLPDFNYGIWAGDPDSVQERRRRFRRDMEMNSDSSSGWSSFDLNEFVECLGVSVDSERMASDGGTVLMSAVEDYRPSTSGRCSVSFGFGVSKEDKEEVEEEEKNSDDGTMSRRISGADFNHMVTPSESPRSLGSNSTSSTRPFKGRVPNRSSMLSCKDRTVGRRKVGWLRRLGIVACVVTEQEEDDSMSPASDESVGRKAGRVKVHQCGKQSKEFSAVYMGQDVKAHEGAICTMKFSPDGQYLATGGEDGIVRVWEVMECDFIGKRDLPEEDPSCIYFTANHNFDLDPMPKNKDKRSKPGVTSRTSNAACIIIPPKVFQISEKPLHEFRGHRGEVLDLSWSKDKCLLSSSDDKSVRLWQVGRNECIKCFPHTDYVTCVQFNPIDKNSFISGSLDCKIRMWDISGGHVISWSDIKEMVTAVCYRPDGKGIVAGSMGGICSFYQISDDNHLQLNERICLQGKKKYPSKRITGFQFSPSNSRKLMVTSADSQVKILDGLDVVCKYKGLRNASSQISASFTSDGRHIISASEDSNVHIWNHSSQDLPPNVNRLRSTRSREHFFTHNVSVAIPWRTRDSDERISIASDVFSSQHEAPWDPNRDSETQNHCHSNILSRTSSRFALNQRFFMELLPRGSATWPEEKLPSISSAASPILSKSDYKFLKACCEKALASHSWGQVIVTAGLDGHIRSYCNYGLPVGC